MTRVFNTASPIKISPKAIDLDPRFHTSRDFWPIMYICFVPGPIDRKRFDYKLRQLIENAEYECLDSV